ncbi:hypothetical protein ACEPAF_977 [Sanghuangporus sanghuang]
MFSYTANIPPEIWVYILRETVFPCWSNEAFFPPPDDFTLITGFKGACSAFKLLAKETERLLRNQNINIVDSGEILRSEDADLIQIKHRDPVYVPLENTNSERFAADLVSTVQKLQRLKLLSVHIVLDHQRSRTALISSIHHVHRMTLKFAPIAFTRCGECIRYYSKVVREYAEVVRSREAKLSVMLAEILPLLEKVMWMDTWNESYCDEEGMRESRIVRMKDGKILVRMQGEVVPPLETFSLD